LATPARRSERLGRRPARPDRKFPSASVRRADLFIPTAKKVLRSRTPEFRIKISGSSSRHANGNEQRGTTPHSRAPASGNLSNTRTSALAMPADLIHLLIGVVFVMVWAMVGRIVATGR